MNHFLTIAAQVLGWWGLAALVAVTAWIAAATHFKNRGNR